PRARGPPPGTRARHPGRLPLAARGLAPGPELPPCRSLSLRRTRDRPRAERTALLVLDPLRRGRRAVRAAECPPRTLSGGGAALPVLVGRGGGRGRDGPAQTSRELAGEPAPASAGERLRATGPSGLRPRPAAPGAGRTMKPGLR